MTNQRFTALEPSIIQSCRDTCRKPNANPSAWPIVVLGLGLFLSGCHKEAPAVAKLPPVRVTAALPVQGETTEFKEFTGRTDAVESVEIRSRVTGYLEEINFYDGAEVKKDEVLYQIDKRPFQAALDQATAEVKLREADLTYRLNEMKRTEPLVPQNAVSQSEFDQIVAAHAQAVAALESAKANEEAARLNVLYTTLRSPIDGETSRSQITKGNLVQADQTVLTTIVSVDPMYVYFDVEEPTILEIQEQIRKGKIKVKQEDQIPVWMALGDKEGFRHQGIIDFAENRFDSSTGTIRLRGKFPNPKPPVGHRILVPELFARVGVPMSEPIQSLMIADRSIGNDQGQKYVLIVNDKNVVEYRPVTPGKLEKQLRVITAGLKPNDRVIVTGIQRVRPGDTVEVKMVDMAGFASPTEEKSEKSESSDVAQPKVNVSETPEKNP